MKAKSVIIAAVGALGCVLTSAASAHAKLESSRPQANAVVSSALTQLRLQFNEPLELPFSKVKLVDEKGAVVNPSRTELDEADPKILLATVPVLHSGSYHVQWSTVTRDGHKAKGGFAFKVK